MAPITLLLCRARVQKQGGRRHLFSAISAFSARDPYSLRASREMVRLRRVTAGDGRTIACTMRGTSRTREWILLSTIQQGGGRDGVSGGSRLKPKHKSPGGKPHGYEERMRRGRVRARRRIPTIPKCRELRGTLARSGPGKTRIAGRIATVGSRIPSGVRVMRRFQPCSNGRSPLVRLLSRSMRFRGRSGGRRRHAKTHPETGDDTWPTPWRWPSEKRSRRRARDERYHGDTETTKRFHVSVVNLSRTLRHLRVGARSTARLIFCRAPESASPKTTPKLTCADRRARNRPRTSLETSSPRDRRQTSRRRQD